MSKMSGKGVQNGGRMWTERTKQTGEKSQAPIRPMRPIGPIRLMKTRCRTCVQNEGTRCPEWGLVVVASVPDGGFTPLRSSLKTIYTHVQNEVNRCPKWGSPLCGSAPLAGPATAGKKRGQVESEKHGTGKYIPVLPVFPVLPNTLSRTGVFRKCWKGV